MKRKRVNPFAGKPDEIDTESRSPEDMSVAELLEELRKMKKDLGKKEFNRLMKEALDLYEPFMMDEDHEDEDTLSGFDLVTPEEWGETHPANLTSGSDRYYAELANDIADLIDDFKLPASAPDNLSRELGRVLAAYLEDLVSDTKVFSAMRQVCMRRYGYRLPFFDCDHADYMPDHLNEEDIRFLIWKTACQLGKSRDIVYSPLAPGWELMAAKIFDLLNSRYEDAPEARRVADWLSRSFRKGDYIDIREIATWLVFHNPLTCKPGMLDSIEEEIDKVYLESEMDAMTLAQLHYATIASESWQRSMSPMGCPSKTLVSAMARELGHDALAGEIKDIEVLPRQVYAVSRDKKSRKVCFETSGHQILEVRPDSFGKGFRPDTIRYAACNLLKFKGEYLLNGTLIGGPELKEKWETGHTFLTLEQQSEQAREWIGLLDGKQVVCVGNIKTFLQKLQLPTTVLNKPEDAKNYVILISSELGIAILPDTGYAFDLPGNRFYRKRKAAEISFSDVVFYNSIPHDVALYIQEHGLLPEASIGASQGKETGREIVQNYLAFWIGFYCELPPYGIAPNFGGDKGEDD